MRSVEEIGRAELYEDIDHLRDLVSSLQEELTTQCGEKKLELIAKTLEKLDKDVTFLYDATLTNAKNVTELAHRVNAHYAGVLATFEEADRRISALEDRNERI